MKKRLQKLMKTLNNRAIKTSFVIPVASLLMLAVAAASADAKPLRFFAVLNSGQEVDSDGVNISDSNAFGVAFLTLGDDRMLCYSISYNDLVGVESAAHFHGPAAAETPAAVLFPISPEPSPLGSPKSGCVGPLGRKMRRELNNGLFYINIHSQGEFGSGEIRGQVLPAKEAK
jgi:hypothetical protein